MRGFLEDDEEDYEPAQRLRRAPWFGLGGKRHRELDHGPGIGLIQGLETGPALDFEQAQYKRETEFTLGFGTLLGIFFALVILCGLCFGLGYEVGRSSASPSATLPTGTPVKHAIGSGASKPSAQNTPVPGQNNQNQAQNQGTYAGQGAGQGSAQAANQGSSQATGQAANQTKTPAAGNLVASAYATPTGTQTPAAPAPAVAPPQRAQPPAPSGPFMVQVTAVSDPLDGDLLVSALKKRGYQVSVRRESDSLIHVRLGPFTSREDAVHWRQQLLNDGYPAQIQQ